MIFIVSFNPDKKVNIKLQEEGGRGGKGWSIAFKEKFMWVGGGGMKRLPREVGLIKAFSIGSFSATFLSVSPFFLASTLSH